MTHYLPNSPLKGVKLSERHKLVQGLLCTKMMGLGWLSTQQIGKLVNMSATTLAPSGKKSFFYKAFFDLVNKGEIIAKGGTSYQNSNKLYKFVGVSGNVAQKVITKVDVNGTPRILLQQPLEQLLASLVGKAEKTATERTQAKVENYKQEIATLRAENNKLSAKIVELQNAKTTSSFYNLMSEFNIS